MSLMEASSTCFLPKSMLLRTSSLRKQVLVGIVIKIGVQFSGIDAIFYYSTLMFRHANVEDPQLATTLLSLVNLAMTWIAMGIMGKAGRRGLIGDAETNQVAALLCAALGTTNATLRYENSPQEAAGEAFAPAGRSNRSAAWAVHNHRPSIRGLWISRGKGLGKRPCDIHRPHHTLGAARRARGIGHAHAASIVGQGRFVLSGQPVLKTLIETLTETLLDTLPGTRPDALVQIQNRDGLSVGGLASHVTVTAWLIETRPATSA